MTDYNKKLLEQIESIKDEKIVFWGASLFLEEFLKENNLEKYNIVGIIDKNPARWGEKFENYEIFDPNALKDIQNAKLILTIENDNLNIYKELQAYISKNYPNAFLCANIFDSYEDQVLEQLKYLKLKTIKDGQKINSIENECKKNNKILKVVENKLEKQQRMQYLELQAGIIFNNIINNTNWITKKDFIPTNAAATYNFLCNLFSILEYIQPKNILEFGLGQSTKLTSAYVANKNKKAVLDVIDEDKDWIEYFSKQIISHKNVRIYHKNTNQVCDNEPIYHKYQDLVEQVGNKKYDLIIIDGPIAGNKLYPRTNIIDLIPNNLAEDFIIILDDAERDGEKRTADLIFDKLVENEIDYVKSYKIATKTQLIITSPKYKYVSFY
ncbi:MAG: hypothetical protein E7Z89_07285 [Cyanobacteria bacterium SIG28]|nr:hypothetical protein [Cyanobacteria bacterium SIG28]